MKHTFIKIYFIISYLALGVWAWGLPEGTTPVQGAGNVQINGKEMIITAPDGSIFEHQSFNIGADEILRFEQPSSQARVLNRVTGSIPSQIDGQLLANGQMYLVNPSGIIFGAGAVVEAARLHVVAGVLSNDDFVSGIDNFSALLAPVENSGLIEADQVVFAGSSVSNSGSLKATAGEVVLGAGGSMTLSSADGFLAVAVSSESTAPIGVATDMIGQSLLNSGIIQAKETHLLGNQITHTGTVESDTVVLSDFNQVSASDGTFTASNLSVLGSGSSNVAIPSATLNSSTNRISKLHLSGHLNQLKVRSSVQTTVEAEGVNRSLGVTSLQHGDIRVSGGDLNLKVSFAPVFSSQSATLLLASENNLNLEPSLQTFGNFYQLLMYGKNVESADISNLENLLSSLVVEYQNATLELAPIAPSNEDYLTQLSNEITAIENTLSDLYAMNGHALSIDDLSIGLDDVSIQKLAADNPNSSAFSGVNNQAFGINQVTGESPLANDGSSLINPTQEQPGETPTGSTLSTPIGIPGSDPGYQALLADQSTGILTPAQIQLAVKNGLFANYSYYLDSSSDLSPVVEAIGESGGVSSIFGGSYAVVESVTSGPSVSSVETDSGSSAAESETSSEVTEESSESAEDSSEADDSDSGSTTGSSGGKSTRSVSTRQVLGVAPFAPISSPVLSPAASLILEEALSPRVEMKLSNYIDR